MIPTNDPIHQQKALPIVAPIMRRILFKVQRMFSQYSGLSHGLQDFLHMVYMEVQMPACKGTDE